MILSKYMPTYSTFNTFSSLLLLLKNKNIPPLLLCNSLGIFLSFHVAKIIYPASWDCIISNRNCSKKDFFLGNFVFHILPVILAFVVLKRRKLHVKLWHPIATSIFHILYCMIQNGGSLCLDNVYAPMPSEIWKVLWSTSILGHFLGYIIAGNYRMKV